MTEIDKPQSISPVATQTRRSILAKFIANFSGGVTPNTMRDSGKTSLALVSAGLDSRQTHTALKDGGHSTNSMQNSFLEMVPIDRIGNVLQQSNEEVVHVSEGAYSDPLETAPRPAVISTEPSSALTEKPSKVIYINVYSVNEQPGKAIAHLFNPDRKLKSAA